jgi:hypothetical protein
MQPIIVFGPIEQHLHQRVLVFATEQLPSICEGDLFGFAARGRLLCHTLDYQG